MATAIKQHVCPTSSVYASNFRQGDVFVVARDPRIWRIVAAPEHMPTVVSIQEAGSAHSKVYRMARIDLARLGATPVSA